MTSASCYHFTVIYFIVTYTGSRDLDMGISFGGVGRGVGGNTVQPTIQGNRGEVQECVSPTFILANSNFLQNSTQ